jgi:hypothetical protein
MSRKGKMVTPRQYSKMHGVPYTTVMYWLQNGKVEGAVKHQTPTGHYWELPDNTPHPPSLAGRPPKLASEAEQSEQSTTGDAEATAEAAPAPRPAKLMHGPTRKARAKKSVARKATKKGGARP